MVAITPLYAGFFGFVLVWLSWRIVSLRNKTQIKMGDGGHEELIAATRAQDNLLEYLPVALLLMLIAEQLEFSAPIIHGLGLLLVLARVLHLKGLREPSGKSKLRKLGTRLTWLQVSIGATLCIAGAFGYRI